MLQCFAIDSDASENVQIDLVAVSRERLPTPSEPERESVRIVIIGSLEGVNQMVLTLHHLRFAEVHRWSRPIPTGHPGEIMRILIRTIRIN